MPRFKKEKEMHQVIVIDDDSDDNDKNADMTDAKSSSNKNSDAGSSNSSNIEDSEDEDDEVFNVDDLMPVPKPAAKKSRFPPGCSVVVAQRRARESNDHNGKVGKVVQVVINFTSKSRPNLFQVELNTAGSGSDNAGTETIVLTEKSLSYAPGCPVWLSSNHAEEDQNAVVLGSEYYPADPEEQLEASVLYSIQTLVVPSKIYHGVLPHQLAYRSTSATGVSHNQSSNNNVQNVKAEPNRIPGDGNTIVSSSSR